MTGEWGILKRKRENVWGQTFSRVSGREIEMIMTQEQENPLSRVSHGCSAVPLIPMCFISAVNVSIVSV